MPAGTERLCSETRGGRKSFGDVTVKWQTVAFRKFKLYSQELIGQTVLNLPAQECTRPGCGSSRPPPRSPHA